MSLKKKIIYFILIFLFICLSYYYYYGYLSSILNNSCVRYYGIYGSDSLLLNLIRYYEKTEGYFNCPGGDYELAKNIKFTLFSYILFLWLTIIPFIIYKFELKKKYSFLKSNKLYITGLIILILIVLFGYLTTNTSPNPYPNGLPLYGKEVR